MTHPAPTQLATKDLFRLDGRTILISGGAGAVGVAVGKAILESGGDVVFLDLLPSIPEATWRDILASAAVSNSEAHYRQLDVQEEAAIITAMEQMRSGLRRPIRGLVACAAMPGQSGACDYPADVFRRILDVNITGTFLIARAAAKEMHRANVLGSVVLVASISGHVSNRGLNTSAYNASKAALHQLARSLAAEWGHLQNTFAGGAVSATSSSSGTTHLPIRVNTLSPGHINTPLSDTAGVGGLTDEWARQNMLGRISQPEEFRAPVLFLLGEGSSYMTGAVGGPSCRYQALVTDFLNRIFGSMGGIAHGSDVTPRVKLAGYGTETHAWLGHIAAPKGLVEWRRSLNLG